MYVEATHPEITRENIQEAIGWDLTFVANCERTVPPTDEEGHLLRQDLDPDEIYVGDG